jgi:glycosyltransferase involved in cell wall biosynthesis
MVGQAVQAVPSEPNGKPAAVRATVVHVMTDPGSLTFLSGQASFIRDAGFAVHAVASPGEYLSYFRDKEGATVHAVPMSRSISPVRDVVALWRLCRVLRGIRPDIVHAHTPKGGLLGMLAAWICGAPIRIYNLRGRRDEAASGPIRHLLRLCERTTCSLAHRVIPVSHSLRRGLIEDMICRPDKIKVLVGGSGNGVDATERFKPLAESVRLATRARYQIPSEALVIGFVGRLTGDKGIAELTRAWKRLREEEPRLHLLLAGDVDPASPAPREIIAALEADPRVHRAGWDWNTPPLYAAMDVVALPTYREGFPNVALEAAAMALPIVATSVTGCVDAVQDGVTGLLVPARDAEALGDALLRYLSNRMLRTAHGAAARRRVLAEFRREAIWGAIAGEYRDLVERRGPSCTRAVLRI